jgi:hypothetical protein
MESGIIISLVCVSVLFRQGEIEMVSTYVNMCIDVEVWR